MRITSKVTFTTSWIRSAIALYLVIASTSPVFSEGVRCDGPTYTVSSKQYPFKGLPNEHDFLNSVYEAICGESECAFSDKNEFYQTVAKFVSIEYSLDSSSVSCPYSSEFCQKVDSWKKFSRKITVDGQDLVDSLTKELQKLSYGGCDYLNVSTNSTEIDDKTLVIRGAYEGKDRFCDNILGTWDVGKSTGKYFVRATMFTYPNAPPFPLGTENLPERDFNIEFDHAVYDQKNTFLVIFDTKTFLGNLVRRLLSFPFDFTTRLFSDKKTTSDYLRDIKNLASRTDLGQIGKFLSQDLAKLPSLPVEAPNLFPDGGAAIFPYSLSVDGTKFSRGANGNFTIELSYQKAVPDIPQYVNAERDAQCIAIKIFNSLSEEPENHVVVSGDKLEKIVLSKYGTKQLVHYLRNRNGMASIDRLRVGESLVLPPLWEVSRDVRREKLILWSENFYSRLTSLGYSPKEAMKIIRDERLNNLVYPLDYPLREIQEKYPVK
jgi:hypothetical protein